MMGRGGRSGMEEWMDGTGGGGERRSGEGSGESCRVGWNGTDEKKRGARARMPGCVTQRPCRNHDIQRTNNQRSCRPSQSTTTSRRLQLVVNLLGVESDIVSLCRCVVVSTCVDMCRVTMIVQSTFSAARMQWSVDAILVTVQDKLRLGWLA